MDDLLDSDRPRKRTKLDDGKINDENLNSKASQTALHTQPQDSQSVRSTNTMAELGEDAQASREKEVGILEYVSPDALGFTGIFKKRYSDFIVNEILPSGGVVHLTKLRAPKLKVSFRKRLDETAPEAAVSQIVGDSNQDQHEDDTGPQSEKAKVEHDLKTTDEGEPADEKHDGQGADQTEVTSGQNSNLETAALAKWEESRDKSEVQVIAEDRATLDRFFDNDTILQIISLFNNVINSPHRSASQYGFVYSKPVTDRDLRTEAHEAIKRIFRLRLQSSTDGKGVITIAAADPRSFGNHSSGTGRQSFRGGGSAGHSDRNRSARGKGKKGANDRSNLGPKKSQKEIFQELGGDYLHFTLYKENKDTLEVISYIARQLKLRPNAFQFAGNKDRRAVTTQRASVYRTFPDKLSHLNRSLRNARVGDFEFKDDKLALGDLQGNSFHITLRDCGYVGSEPTDCETRKDILSARVRSSLESLSKDGFINYFGLQRFGSFATRTDQVGLKLLQGDLKGAIDCILDFSPDALAAAMDSESTDAISRDDKDRAMALHMFRETGASWPALNTLPRKFSAESNIVRLLGEENRSRDYKNALESIPRNLRMMYVHAYQSLIWNLAASHRWKTWGTQVMEGDLVLVKEHKDKILTREPNVEVDDEGEAVVRPGQEDRAVMSEERYERARALSVEEAANGLYTIFDVVLPTPGFDILYPKHMIDFYKETMGSEQYGQLDPFDMTRSWKDISLSGSYRKILAKPLDGCSWQVNLYEDENAQLVPTDLDILQAQTEAIKKPGKEQSAESKQTEASGSQSPQKNSSKGKKAYAAIVYAEQTSATAITIEPNESKDKETAIVTADIGPTDGVTATTEPGDDTAKELHATATDVEQHRGSIAINEKPGEGNSEPTAQPLQRIGITLEFKLGTSQYATMALRELMKHGGAQEHKPDYSSGRGVG